MNSDDEIAEKVNSLIEQLKPKLGDIDLETIAREAEIRKIKMLRNNIRDELPQWQQHDKTVLAGSKFVIAPSWCRELVATSPEFSSLTHIIIDPGVAFGSGHPTSLLCLEALEKYWHGGNLLDIGTGTGLLAMVAALLAPTSNIEAFDISEDIVDHARLHLELNHLSHRVKLRHCFLDAYPEDAAFDVITGNLLPDTLKILKTDINARLKPGGILILSSFPIEAKGRTFASFDWGYTVSEGMGANDVGKMFLDLGMELIEELHMGEWACLILKSAPVLKSAPETNR